MGRSIPHNSHTSPELLAGDDKYIYTFFSYTIIIV